MVPPPAIELDAAHPTRHWRPLPDGRVQCDVCPRSCRLREGQRGMCFVRACRDRAIVLTTYGRSSGFCVDPIEKKPLHHFLPGTAVLSFGTAGCNLACKFCQNWTISRARAVGAGADRATPGGIATTAAALGCSSVAFTYNDPVVFMEYAVDTAEACRRRGIRTVAVTAGEICPVPRAELFAAMDAANVDLKAFTDRFYRRLCGSRLAPVLETLEYVRHETGVWLEITTLLIPGENDSDAEIAAEVRWIHDQLGPEVPLHFTAFRPDWKMRHHRPTPPATLSRARRLALDVGLHHVYTGNVRDPEGAGTRCAGCGRLLIGRDGYALTAWSLEGSGRCRACGRTLPGVFTEAPGRWGPRRQPVRIDAVLRPRRGSG